MADGVYDVNIPRIFVVQDVYKLQSSIHSAAILYTIIQYNTSNSYFSANFNKWIQIISLIRDAHMFDIKQKKCSSVKTGKTFFLVQ